MNKKSLTILAAALAVLILISACASVAGTATAVPTNPPPPTAAIQPTEAAPTGESVIPADGTRCYLKAYPNDYPDLVVYLNVVGDGAQLYCDMMPTASDSTMTIVSVDSAPQEPVSCSKVMEDGTEIFVVGEQKTYGDSFCEGFNP